MAAVIRAQDQKAKADLYEAAVRAEVTAMQHLSEDLASAGTLLRKTRFSKMSDAVWNATWNNMGPLFKSPFVSWTSLAGWLDNGLVDGARLPHRSSVR